MINFYKRALEKLPKLGKEQIRSLVMDIVSEIELLEDVLDSMTDGVMVSDRDHMLIHFNKSSERLLLLMPGDVAGKKIWEVISDKDVSSFLKTSLNNQEKIVDREFCFDSGGISRILSCSIMPMVRNGEILGNLLHIEDITEKKQKDARLRRAESLATLTTLAAGVAHEIKNPLGSISIHIQLIQRFIKGKKKVDPSKIEHYLDVVNEEVDRLNRIVIDFLFSVRPMDAEFKRCDFNKIIREFVEFIHFELEESNISVVEKLSMNIPELFLDEKYIKQALLNLINNASSAMPDGGVITISTERNGKFVILSIADTGKGIPEEIMGKIFEPYFTTKDFGSGLGLTVVYKIIKEHLGDISIKSKVNKGTTFTISFPVPHSEKKLIGWEGRKEDEV